MCPDLGVYSIMHVTEYFVLPAASAPLQRVLVPGCGLSRLPLEITARGYACEANEFSMFMLTASHFILNGVFEENSYGILPWVERYVSLFVYRYEYE